MGNEKGRRTLETMQYEAAQYARSYRGNFIFMLKMRAIARKDPHWTPSARQTSAILKCRANDPYYRDRA